MKVKNPNISEEQFYAGIYGADVSQMEWRVAPDSAEFARLVRWMHLRDQWLDAPKGAGRTTSANTRYAYAHATRQWLDALQGMPGGAVYPWLARAEHVRVWQRLMGLVQRLSDSTINSRLASVSSWYTFILSDAPDELGANPFIASTVRRSRVRPYGRAHPLGPDRLRRLFEWTEGHSSSLSGARNHALLLTYFLTGCRASEILRMRWGDIRPSRSRPDEFMFLWEGKGGKRAASPLPARAMQAINRYGEMAGVARLPEEHIWLPIMDHGTQYLIERPRSRPYISTTSANRIFHTALRNAGFSDWRQYRIHDLRHSFAHLHYQQTRDLNSLRKLLHHTSLATTDIYVREMADPVDDHSDAVWAALGMD